VLQAHANNKEIVKQLANKEININIENAFIVSDDYNLLENLQIAKAERYRELLVKRLGKEILLR
jgi:hypothetical protein